MACKDCAPERNNPCPDYPNANCIVYSGANLTCLGVKTNDRLSAILAKIDEAVCSISPEVEITMSNLGTGEGIYAQTVGSDYQFKSLVPGTGINISSDSEEITIDLDASYLNSNYWSLTGNSGTSSSTNFLGTTDTESLRFRVNNTLAGRLDWYPGDPNESSVAFGVNALQAMDIQGGPYLCGSVAIGSAALKNNTYGENVAVGMGAMRDAVTAWRNTVMGEYSMFYGRSGQLNAFFGAFSAEMNTGASYNAGFGAETLRGNKQGDWNTAAGIWALRWNTTVVDSIAVTNGGSGYTTATVTISAPDPSSPGAPSTQATATATIDAGVITAITVTNKGKGYSNEVNPVTVTITGDGTGATATATLKSGRWNTGIGANSFWSGRVNQYCTGVGMWSGVGAGGNEASDIDEYSTFIGYAASRSSTIPNTTPLVKSTAIGYNAKVGADKAIVLGATGVDQPNIGIGTITPTDTLHLVGTFRYQDGTEQNGYILTSDANGVASWQAAPAGYTDEEAQDAVGTILSSEFTYNDGTPLISVNQIDWSKIINAPAFITTETDPIYTASSWFSTTNNSTDWNTAYGWGNHASAGYALDANVVHLTGNESIGGTKTFTSDVIVPDEAYGVGWNGSLEAPTKNAVYDKIESLSTGWGLSGNSITGTEYIGTNNNYDLPFYTNGIERMRLNSSGGELLIGTTTDNGDYKLQVNGNSYLNGNIVNNRTLTTIADQISIGSGALKIGVTNVTSARIVVDTWDGLHFDVNGVSDAMVINASGTTIKGDIIHQGDIYNNFDVGMYRLHKYGFASIVTEPTYSFYTDPNTGMFWGGADAIGFTTNGTAKMYIRDAEFSINENGYDFDVRIEGDTDPYLLFTDASTDRVGIGTNSPSAFLHIKAGTTTSAPLKFTAGTNLTAPEAGAIEFNGTNLFYTTSTPARKTIANLDDAQTFASDISVPDDAYDATSWNGNFEVPTKNAIRDKIESMSVGSGITRTVVITSGSVTMGSLAATDYVYFVSGAHVISLPAAAGNTNRYTVKNNHSANITIDTSGAENIEGAASISIAPAESVDIISDGTDWYII